MQIDAPAILAPMSGITDIGMRRVAARFGAGLVISEMVAASFYLAADEETRLRAEGEGWVEIATTPDVSLVYPIEAPGIFRVEVRVTAEHLRPVFYELERFASADYPWIMTNAFRVVSADGG